MCYEFLKTTYIHFNFNDSVLIDGFQTTSLSTERTRSTNIKINANFELQGFENEFSMIKCTRSTFKTSPIKNHLLKYV